MLSPLNPDHICFSSSQGLFEYDGDEDNQIDGDCQRSLFRTRDVRWQSSRSKKRGGHAWIHRTIREV